ncbi:UDP-forming cellulose synthase catalytic subunit, partial [Burkholderia multivorans]
VKPTVFAAQSVDWPTDKLRVYLLDDGRRPEFAAFARDAGIGYLTRDDNLHAKAGNINRALPKTHGEYIAIFDCDHVPTRSFLQTTMGEFLRDPKCALVQTPHHFFSPDPFERNLGTFREVPNEGNLFYGLVQSGNDLWNAAFFCGSCAVLKRSALEEVGGVAVETVTEDAHTALKLHRRGYTSAYLPTVQAAGLATESLAGHVKQRTRWARGMAQIFR